MSIHRTETSLPGLDDSASSLSRYTHTSASVSHARAIPTDVPECRPAKRRKIAGLNTRFDRMIKSVNAVRVYPAPSRERMQSSGTSSVSSHDAPKTPLDAYHGLHPGKLGRDFSLLKMKYPPLLLREDPGGCPKLAAPPKQPRSRLPDWLADTFYSLEAEHPLRGLLSPSRINPESKSNPLAAQLLHGSHEEEVFAFSPFEPGKQQVAPDTAYRADSTLNVQENVSCFVPTEHTLSCLQPKTPASALPFSTPGCFAPIRRSIESSITDGIFQKPSAPVPQQMANMMHPPALPALPLRVDNDIGLPQFTRAFTVQDNEPPSDFQAHGTYVSHNYQVFWGDDDGATPGPTFASSLPVYFDSPTEDPSLSDPLRPESYELDLNAIDFHWHPFLRSNTQESDANRHSASPPLSLRYAVPNHVGDQNGWGARFAVDQGSYGASSEEPSSPTEDAEIAYLDDVGTVLPSNTNTSTISNLIRPWSSPINDVQQAEPALLAVDGVLPRGDEEKIHAGEELTLLRGEDTGAIVSDANETRPLTPVRHVPVSPPSAPQKVRSSELCGVPRAPVRKTSSALSWMIPLKPLKRPTAVHGDADCSHSRVSANSHDSIESWSETS